ncbi:MAG: DUF6629 family protein [Rhizomicrobium sp.]
MCFSASVSFAAAAVLGVTGAAVLTKVRALTELPLASIPLLFAAQQAIEGFLWRTLPVGADHTTALATLFAAIGLIVWPLLIPIAMALVEREPARRLAMLILVPAGIGVSINYAAIMLVRPYRAWPIGHTLTYVNNHPISPVMLGIYILCACTPPLLSASRALNLFGVIVIGGLAVTFLAFYESFISVWCFFAALASLTIWKFFQDRRRATSVQITGI